MRPEPRQPRSPQKFQLSKDASRLSTGGELPCQGRLAVSTGSGTISISSFFLSAGLDVVQGYLVADVRELLLARRHGIHMPQSSKYLILSSRRRRTKALAPAVACHVRHAYDNSLRAFRALLLFSSSFKPSELAAPTLG